MSLETVEGPFGPARHLVSISSRHIASLYQVKCGFDVQPFLPWEQLELYECQSTGYRFWRPAEAAGDETFYRDLSSAWPGYYRNWRWEYDHAAKLLSHTDSVVEIGCGRGYFLRSIEGNVARALGLELNRQAIAAKVCRSEIMALTVESLIESVDRSFDAIAAFQVLEHIPAPERFLAACVSRLAPGGCLILSTPDRDYSPFDRRQDAFDLPPHHMGHFSAGVFARLAGRFGLHLEKVVREPRSFVLEQVTSRTGSQLSYRLFRRAVTTVGNFVYRSTSEPGMALLAVLRKSA
jgi:SAM-dependent methyltransferase